VHVLDLGAEDLLFDLEARDVRIGVIEHYDLAGAGLLAGEREEAVAGSDVQHPAPREIG
jgi:hypothetical protein